MKLFSFYNLDQKAAETALNSISLTGDLLEDPNTDETIDVGFENEQDALKFESSYLSLTGQNEIEKKFPGKGK